MPVITSIKPQKKKKRVNVFVDHKFAFGLDLETYVKSNLKVGNDLTQEKLDEISKMGKRQDHFSKLLSYVTTRPRSRDEIEKWLVKKGVSKDTWQHLLKKLERLELVGDYQFAKWWIDQRSNFRPRGRKMLFYELLKKGVDKKTIEKALKDADIDETAMATDLLLRKSYKWEKERGFRKRKKMSDFLARRGFSWNAIKKALKQVES